MIIEINALDTLFFRDGKPFTMAEETWADAVFPPYPSVIYGALRSAYFSNHIDELGKANDGDDPTKELKINCIYYGIGNDIYLPLPYDCVKEKDDKNEPVRVSMLSMRKNENLNSCPTDYVLTYNNTEVENVLDGFFRKSVFNKYLMGIPEKFAIKRMDDYIVSEPKVGIGIDKKTGTSEEGKLYRVDMKRLSNKKNDKLDIIIDFEGLDLPENGLMKLGGEGKAVRYKKCEKSLNFEIPSFEDSNKRFKIYLSTPAIFKNGWLPKWIDEATLTGEYKGFELKLLTASVGKPVYIGGFDMKARKPKPMHKAVPAGSVYYFEVIKGDIQKAFEIFNRPEISEVYPEQGFGISYVGKVFGGDSIL